MAREEIKEGIMGLLKILSEYCITDEAKLISQFRENSRDGIATQILEFLHSQGVVIKADRELPENPLSLDYEKLPPPFDEDDSKVTAEDVYLMHYNGIEKGKRLMLKAGYVAVEPLVDEKK